MTTYGNSINYKSRISTTSGKSRKSTTPVKFRNSTTPVKLRNSTTPVKLRNSTTTRKNSKKSTRLKSRKSGTGVPDKSILLENSGISTLDVLEDCFSNVVDIDLADSDSAEEEIVIVDECNGTQENHRCELCCEGEFLLDKILRFGGLINEKFKFVCDRCDKNFVYESELKKHLSTCKKRVNGGNNRTSLDNEQQSTEYFCLVCSKNFKSKRGYTKHLKSTHSGLMHTCEICKKVFHNFRKFCHHCFAHKRFGT